GLLFMDRLHRLHLAPAARSHVKGVHLRLRQSRGRGVSGMAGSARAHRPLHRNRQRDHRGFGGAGNKREGLEASCGRRTPRGRSYGRLKSQVSVPCSRLRRNFLGGHFAISQVTTTENKDGPERRGCIQLCAELGLRLPENLCARPYYRLGGPLRPSRDRRRRSDQVTAHTVLEPEARLRPYPASEAIPPSPSHDASMLTPTPTLKVLRMPHSDRQSMIASPHADTDPLLDPVSLWGSLRPVSSCGRPFSAPSLGIRACTGRRSGTRRS